MDMHSPEGASLTPTKRALLEIRQLRAQLAEAEKAWHEPIAIVGMGLRLPGGVRDAESFAKLLWSGADAVTEIPADRWSLEEFYAEDPDAIGKMTTRHGAIPRKCGRIRRRILRYLAARGGKYGSAAATDAGSCMGGIGGCRPCAFEFGW